MQGYPVLVSEAPLIESVLNLLSTPQTNYSLSSHHKPQSSSPLSEKTSSDESERKPIALVVDDTADLAEMLALFVAQAGYVVTSVNSARAAIEAAENTRFDMIISDIGMPRMNGYQLAQSLRALPGYSAVPMIAVTGYSMYDDEENSLKSGFDAHVTKPIDPVALFELIERLRG